MASFLREDDLDEEQARRSILVTNIPANFTYKDVIIHFQKERNGGGEVDSAMHPDHQDYSSVVVTFENPETVEKAISQPHQFGGCNVKVQRYPITVILPQVFEAVQAIINARTNLSRDIIKTLEDEFGVTANSSNNIVYITGSFQQIHLCHDYLLEVICNDHQHPTLEDQTSVASAVGRTNQKAPQPPAQEIVSVFETVPVVWKFISTVGKHKMKLEQIQQDYNVRIYEKDNCHKVAIEAASSDCTEEQHDEGCEKYITLYRSVYSSSMMSKEMVLYLGPGALVSTVQEAVGEIQDQRPVIIQKTDTKDTWLFYGKQKDLKQAVKEVCALLKIEHPFKFSKPVDDPGLQPPVTRSSTRRETYKVDYQGSTSSSGNDPPSEGAILREEFMTKKGFKLSVCQGDITEEQVDVIVISNDEYLRGFDSGLPRYIVEKGGRDIENDALSQAKKRALRPGDTIFTRAGNLPCSHVIHVIFSNVKKSKDVLKNMVKDACLDCLRKTQTRDLKSIGFPAFKFHKAGLSLPHCATAMINAVEEYMKGNDPKKAVTDIRFVHIDSTAFEVFTQELKKRYADCAVKPTGEKDKGQREKTHGGPHPGGARDATPTGKTKTEEAEKDVCPICIDDFSDPVRLHKCNHQFCRSCIDLAFKHSQKCPTCSTAYGVQTGNMPKGTMTCHQSRMSLPGYERYGSITISYSFPPGKQGAEHPNPGQYYTGTSRTAYLPDSPEGQEVLKLLKKAFDARLTFTIGTSVTTGATNTVTWNDIHHKTSPSGGPTNFGYPDPQYLKRVKEELAAKGIS